MVNRTTVFPHRRRREQRTDYRRRLALVRSGKVRLVVRRGTHGVTAQLVQHVSTGDKTLVSIGPKQLAGAGYKGHTGNLPAAYLLGLLVATEAKKHTVSEAVLDIGLHTSSKGSVLYGVLKGAIDGGLQIPHGAEILPDAARTSGEHIAQYAKKIKPDAKKYEKQFSAYLREGVLPENLPEHVSQVAAKLGKAKK